MRWTANGIQGSPRASPAGSRAPRSAGRSTPSGRSPPRWASTAPSCKDRSMFRIGEFSRIARVSCRLLRYYDEIGLFTPARIEQASGYRYYSAAQLPRLNRILVLRELGLSLEQI